MILTYPDTLGPYPCMLCLHGFLSYKEGDGHLLQKSAQYLAEHGIASARIDFCSMGENRASAKCMELICVSRKHMRHSRGFKMTQIFYPTESDY